VRAAVFLLLTLLCARAYGQATEEGLGEYHLRRAQQAIDLNAWQTAMQEFQAAAPVMTPQELEYELARCLFHLGRTEEATTHYEHLAAQNGALAEASRARLAEIDELVYAQRHPPKSIGAPLVVGVGAILAAGVGAVLVGSGLTPLGSVSTFDCPAPCGTRRSLEQRVDIGYAFFGLAGAGAIVDTVLWVRWKRSHAGPPPRQYDGLHF